MASLYIYTIEDIVTYLKGVNQSMKKTLSYIRSLFYSTQVEAMITSIHYPTKITVSKKVLGFTTYQEDVTMYLNDSYQLPYGRLTSKGSENPLTEPLPFIDYLDVQVRESVIFDRVRALHDDGVISDEDRDEALGILHKQGFNES